MNETIIAVGNGGFNLATYLIAAGLFPNAQLIVCDTNQRDLEKNSVNASETFLLEKLRGKVKSGDTTFVKEIVAKASESVIVCATLGFSAIISFIFCSPFGCFRFEIGLYFKHYYKKQVTI